ncbi:MAG: hypothetical protein IPO81_17850 [Kouleothrix sp.]|nr:hypothetical protein [Kouleothrix sp.]
MLQIQPARPRVEPTTTYRVFVYHHTHWDREWWAPLQDFRIRLVELVDDLLDALDSDPEFRCFLLDGQAIVLKDYLEIRPENRARLVAYINDYRIQCGPWYVLPDEFLVSGEAHVRNLWLGERMAERLGYRNLDVGYLPDTFGHIGQMPQILRGFGIDSAMIWRGLGGAPEQFKQEFTWEAADDSRVLAYWFPDGYYQMPFLHFDNPLRPDSDKLGRVRRLVEQFAAHATTDCILLPYGGDHQPIDRRLPRLLREANEAFAVAAGLGIRDLGPGKEESQAPSPKPQVPNPKPQAPSPKPQAPAYEFHWSTTQEFIEAIRARGPDLEVRKGEFRGFGAGLPHLLPGVLSTRLYLKQLNAAGQTWLERYAEPMAALAWLRGRPYDAGLLWAAWELLVQNHPHDSICGCSVDQVHREMIARFDQSRQIAEIVAEKSARHIDARIDTADLPDGALALVAHNPLSWRRCGPAAVLVERDLGVGPRTHALHDHEGRELPFQVKDVDRLRPMGDRWRFSEIRFVADVPALGYATYTLSRRAEPHDQRQRYFSSAQPAARLKGSAPVGDLRVGDGVLENHWLRVEASPRDGSLRVIDKRSGASYAGLNVFEDGGDAGDEYTYAAPLSDTRLRSDQGTRAHVTVAEAGHASATLRIDLDWSLPAALSADRLSRQADYVEHRITTFVTLSAGARLVEIATEWENRSSDHRLRALFPLGAPIAVSHAEGQFEVVERPVSLAGAGNGWAEPYAPTLPQQGYVSVGGGGRGLTVVNRGLPEFEATADGTVALTLLRAVGWLSREDLLARVGGAGPEIPTPEAQCLGRQRAEYAIIPHGAGWLAARAYQTAHEYLAPLYGSVADRHAGSLPRRAGLIEIDGEHTLLLSACKKAERSDALILRFWNVAGTATEARVHLGGSPTSARLVDLKERPVAGGALALADDGSFVLRAGPAKIVTVAIRFSDEGGVDNGR